MQQTIDPRSLVDVRLQLHWATQLAAMVGRALAPQHMDDRHSSFRWVDARQAIVQEDLCHSGLRFLDLTLLLGDDELPLHGSTIDQAFAWIERHAPGVVKVFDDPMPRHRVGDGAPFDASDHARFEALAAYYAEASPLLRAIHDDVRCWPHHFDIATLLEFDGGKSIGAGLSPGDDTCPEPYWYVNHSPETKHRDLPPLDGGGTWHTTGWIGAILPASVGGDARSFLTSAIEKSRELLSG